MDNYNVMDVIREILGLSTPKPPIRRTEHVHLFEANIEKPYTLTKEQKAFLEKRRREESR